MKKLFAILILVLPATLSFGGNHSGIGPGSTPIVPPITGPVKGPGMPVPYARSELAAERNMERSAPRSGESRTAAPRSASSQAQLRSQGPR